MFLFWRCLTKYCPPVVNVVVHNVYAAQTYCRSCLSNTLRLFTQPVRHLPIPNHDFLVPVSQKLVEHVEWDYKRWFYSNLLKTTLFYFFISVISLTHFSSFITYPIHIQLLFWDLPNSKVSHFIMLLLVLSSWLHFITVWGWSHGFLEIYGKTLIDCSETEFSIWNLFLIMKTNLTLSFPLPSLSLLDSSSLLTCLMFKCSYLHAVVATRTFISFGWSVFLTNFCAFWSEEIEQ